MIAENPDEGDNAENSTNTIVETEYEDVLYRGYQYRRGEVEVAAEIQERIGVPVILQAGPYRPHNIHYDIGQSGQFILLDFYSVRPASGYDIDRVVRDIKRGLREIQELE